MKRAASISKIHVVRALVLKPILVGFDGEKPKLLRLLHEYGLDQDLFADDYLSIPLELYLRLFEGAAHILNDPLLGARLGITMKPGDLGPVGLRVMQSASIRHGLEVIARYVAILQSGTSVSFEKTGDEYVFTYAVTSPTHQHYRQDAEFTLAGTCKLIRTGFNPRWRPKLIAFQHEQHADAAKLERMFGAPIQFSQTANRLVIDAAEMEKTWRTEDPALIALIERHMMDMFNDAPDTRSISEQVTALISIYLGRRPVNLTSIASGLDTSPRNLQRRLASEGTKLSDLLRDYRIQRAATLLGQNNMTVESASALLGYADATAFWRAYRTWTGRSPSQDIPN